MICRRLGDAVGEEPIGTGTVDYFMDARKLVEDMVPGEDPVLARLQAALPGYDIEVVDDTYMLRLDYPNTYTGGAWELQLQCDENPEFKAQAGGEAWRVLGDYMSERTTAAVGLDHSGTLDEIIAAIKEGEQEATRYADRETQ